MFLGGFPNHVDLTILSEEESHEIEEHWVLRGIPWDAPVQITSLNNTTIATSLKITHTHRPFASGNSSERISNKTQRLLLNQNYDRRFLRFMFPDVSITIEQANKQLLVSLYLWSDVQVLLCESRIFTLRNDIDSSWIASLWSLSLCISWHVSSALSEIVQNHMCECLDTCSHPAIEIISTKLMGQGQIHGLHDGVGWGGGWG